MLPPPIACRYLTALHFVPRSARFAVGVDQPVRLTRPTWWAYLTGGSRTRFRVSDARPLRNALGRALLLGRWVVGAGAPWYPSVVTTLPPSGATVGPLSASLLPLRYRVRQLPGLWPGNRTGGFSVWGPNASCLPWAAGSATFAARSPLRTRGRPEWAPLSFCTGGPLARSRSR